MRLISRGIFFTWLVLCSPTTERSTLAFLAGSFTSTRFSIGESNRCFYSKFASKPTDEDDGNYQHSTNSDKNVEEVRQSASPDSSSSPPQRKPDASTPLGEDIAKKLSASRNKAISALSQPSSQTTQSYQKEKQDSGSRRRNQRTATGKRKYGRIKDREALFPKAGFRNEGLSGKRKSRRSRAFNPSGRRRKPEDSAYSLLPPPMNVPINPASSSSRENDSINDNGSTTRNSNDKAFSEGLSVWEDFLGEGPASSQQSYDNKASSPTQVSWKSRPSSFSNENLYSGRKGSPQQQSQSSNEKKVNKARLPSNSKTNNDVVPPQNGDVKENERLPSITDLFPPDLSDTRIPSNSGIDGINQKTKSIGLSSILPPSSPALDGVLPVSDLFYRSSQSIDTNNDEDVERDDEELPFSAEQSDQLATGNKIKVRRNQANTNWAATANTRSYPLATPPSKRRRKPGGPRKMIRRGMEMLVGGVPINADPPQRFVDLIYIHDQQKQQQKEEETAQSQTQEDESETKWNQVISINSRDFGPMLHSSSVGLVTEKEQGLYCEHFVHNALKWDVCPKDLRAVAKEFTDNVPGTAIPQTRDEGEEKVGTDSRKADVESSATIKSESEAGTKEDRPGYSIKSSLQNDTSAGEGFGKNTRLRKKKGNEDMTEHLERLSALELVFSIGVSREELESGDSPSDVPVLERVLARGITALIECSGFSVAVTKLCLKDLDDGTTMISSKFELTTKGNNSTSYGELEKKALRINSAIAQAMDDGDLQLAMAAAAQEETGWPVAVRDRVVEEFLFDDDDGDEPVLDKKEEEDQTGKDALWDWIGGNEDKDEDDGPFGMPGSVEYHKDDIFLGKGNDGVFWDYSEDSVMQSPYKGSLGPRLVDAVVERAKQRRPRVIAIGDVHGCIDELQDLLRQCDYRPGDQVVFLGDLVSKGPDSISVVQMAREIGAIGVRGNHDFEVIRWHQAIKSGVDPPVVGSEHFHIASCLTKADMKWLYSLPWYMSSKELGALFVHAGFVSGIRLAKQNPRLMMNMRSILPDGTVTSKFFNNWPWARLWDGPQTVLFGHDADRGLQQYEHAIGLDTGCVYGGRLTACILPEKRLVSVSARREYFKYRRKHYD